MERRTRGRRADAGEVTDSGGDGGTTVDLQKPVFCPEKGPFSPKNANSVVVSDVVLRADATWTADKVHLIGEDLEIQGHELTVEGGTTICLHQTRDLTGGSSPRLCATRHIP